MSYIYMEVTQDKYELPTAVAETALRLAQMVGVDVKQIQKAIYKREHLNHRTRFVRVRMEA